MIPFGLGSGIGMPIIGAAIIAVCAFMAYGVSTIKSAGAAGAEMRRISEIAVENKESAEALEHDLKVVRRSEKKAKAELAKVRKRTRRAHKKIDAIPKGKGKPGICPIDCILPPGLP